MRRYLARDVFRAVLIERDRIDRTHNPLAPMLRALDGGNSLIVFSEGTRGSGRTLLPFKCGIWHLANARPDVELVPVWIDKSLSGSAEGRKPSRSFVVRRHFWTTNPPGFRRGEAAVPRSSSPDSGAVRSVVRSQSLMILAVIAVVLAVATLAGSFLRVLVRQTARGTGAAATIDNLNARIKSWWAIVFVLGGAAIAGRTAVIILFAMISFVALREFLALTVLEATDRRALVAVFAVALPVQYALAGSGRSDWFVGFLPVAGVPLVSVLIALTGNSRNYMARTAELTTGLLVCVYCISYVPALLNGNGQGLLMIFLILIAQASDILQYSYSENLPVDTRSRRGSRLRRQ